MSRKAKKNSKRAKRSRRSSNQAASGRNKQSQAPLRRDSRPNKSSATQSKAQLPVSVACPKCKQDDYKQVSPKSWVAFRLDRVCRKCGARWSPPTPVWAAWVFILIGMLFTLVMLVEIPLLFTDTSSPGLLIGMAIDFPVLIVGLLCLRYGFRQLTRARV